MVLQMTMSSQSGSRLSIDEYFLQMATLVAKRGTCVRRQVGCVLVDDKLHVLATGYNGVASGRPHCIDHPCEGAKMPSGQGLHLCQAIHAEQNALIQCREVHRIYAAFCTVSPCIQCVHMLMNTSCIRVVFRDNYPHTESRNHWLASGREWIHVPEQPRDDIMVVNLPLNITLE